MSEIIKKLEEIFGKENVVKREDILDFYRYDAQPLVGERPLATVFPQNIQQIKEFLAYASKNRIPVYVRGGGTALTGAPIPLDNNAVVLSMYQLNQVRKIYNRDFQVHVEAGVIVDELNATLRPHGLFFPIDPGSSAAATIGGAIANNAGGVRAVKYGTMKDGWVLKLHVVLPNGDDYWFGTRTFKVNTGYDFVHLFVGSEGTLGVITEAFLKVTSLPKYKSVARAFFRDERIAAEFVIALLHMGLEPTAVEFLDRDTLEAVHRYSGLKVEGNAMVLVEFSGSFKEEIDRKMAVLERELRNYQATSIVISKTEDEYKEIWLARKAAAPALGNLKPKYLILDPTVPISKIPDLIDICRNIARKYNVRIATFGHAGDGNVHPNILYDPRDKDEFRRALQAAEEIAMETIRLGGTVSGEHGIGIEKIKTFEAEVDGLLDLMWSLKKLFDPYCILNRGKVFPEGYWQECS